MMEVDAAQQTNGRHDEEDGPQESLSSELQETARSNHDPVTVVVEIKTNGCLNAPSAIAHDCSGASPPPPLACSPPPSPRLAAGPSPRHGSSPLLPARLGPLSAEQLSAVLRGGGGATVPASSSSSSSSVTTTTNRSPAAATSSPATLERLQAELRGLRDEMDTMKSQHNKEIKLLMNELDEEKRIRLTMQMEMQRMNKRMSKMS